MSSSVSFSGAASGIDTDALVDATISAKREQRITPLEDKVAEAEDESSAMTTLKDMLNDFKDTLSKYTALSGGAVQMQATSNDETVVGVVASSSASAGTYDVTVNALAQKGSFTIGSKYATQDSLISSSISGSETVKITVGTGTRAVSKDISITNSTTISSLAENINNLNMGCTAVVVNVGSTETPSYTMMISSNGVGLSSGYLNVTTSSSNTDISTLVNSGQLKQAQDANFSIAGLASNITRSSNAIADVIPGVTFSLQSVGSTSVNVSNDADTTMTNVQSIVNAFNDIVTYVSENDTVERDESGDEVKNIFAALSKTNVDNSVITSMKNVISSTKEESGTYVRIFADFGITTNTKTGTLDFDTDKFEEVFAKEANSINSIITQFADKLSLTGGVIDQYTRYNGLMDIVINNNTTQISDYNSRISRYESMLKTEEENLKAKYARFESLMSELQSSSSSLTSLLSSK